MFKEEFSVEDKIFIDIILMLDLWYYWVETDYWDQIKKIFIPEKKPRKSKNNPKTDLTTTQKENNKEKAKIRVKIENSIAWVKRFGIVSQIFRNKGDKFNDDIMQTACSLRNMHLIF